MNEEHNDSTLIQTKYKDTGKVHSDLRKELGMLGKRSFKIFTKTFE